MIVNVQDKIRMGWSGVPTLTIVSVLPFDHADWVVIDGPPLPATYNFQPGFNMTFVEIYVTVTVPANHTTIRDALTQVEKYASTGIEKSLDTFEEINFVIAARANDSNITITLRPLHVIFASSQELGWAFLGGLGVVFAIAVGIKLRRRGY